MQYVFFLLLCQFAVLFTSAQDARAFNNNATKLLSSQGKFHTLFKMTVSAGLKKGASIGLSYGMWRENPSLQVSLNTGFMWRFGKAFLGNYRDGANMRDSRSKSQFVFMFSPMGTANLGGKEFVYQELEPFYFGTANAVYSKFRNSVTLGSTFTISPRGTYKNVTTTRNRAQQVFVLSVNVKNFNLTIYDDYFPLFTTILQLGDNWDRFFTGGGFIRYRFNDEFRVHLYSEVYTGINRANAFLNPDIITYRPSRGNWKRKNYANQDPGQEYFNNSWLMAKVSYSAPAQVGTRPGIYMPDFHAFVGSSAPWTMFSQNWVHNLIKYDDSNKMRLHYFMPRANVPGNLEAGGGLFMYNIHSLFLGGGIQSNISLP